MVLIRIQYRNMKYIWYCQKKKGQKGLLGQFVDPINMRSAEALQQWARRLLKHMQEIQNSMEQLIVCIAKSTYQLMNSHGMELIKK